MLVTNPGSFKDPSGRVYHRQGRVLRGLNQGGADVCKNLFQRPFFSRLVNEGKIVGTEYASAEDEKELIAQGWAAALCHQRVPFLSYCYEWPFAMLKDAALLQLELCEQAAKDGWILKDATPYNIQWFGARPTFIDIPSLQLREQGAPWAGYRQFCMTFLFPLMLRAHLDINYAPILRSHLDGADAGEILKYFSGLHLLKKGVLPHVVFPALAESAAKKRARSRKPASESRQPDALLLGLIRGLQNTIGQLSRRQTRTTWSHYESEHSYGDEDVKVKREFVRECVSQKRRKLAWDLGCNTGAYSQICAEHADYVVAVDGDDASVEQLYLSQKKSNTAEAILPLTMDLANMSPGQGWAGEERPAFSRRESPDFVLCLALVHHLRIGANIPLPMFLDYLRSLNAEAVVEFVGREDDMTRLLLRDKSETYPDYSLEAFQSAVKERFEIVRTQEVKHGDRTLYFLHPR